MYIFKAPFITWGSDLQSSNLHGTPCSRCLHLLLQQHCPTLQLGLKKVGSFLFLYLILQIVHLWWNFCQSNAFFRHIGGICMDSLPSPVFLTCLSFLDMCMYVCMCVCVCVCVYCLWDSCSPWQNYAVVCLEVQSLLFVDSICYYYDMIKCRPSHRKIHELFEWSAITLLFFTFVFLTYVCTFFLFIPEVSDWSALSAQYWKGALCPSQNNKVLSIMILM